MYCSFAVWAFPRSMAANLDFFLKIHNSICRMMVLKSLSTGSGLISCFSKDFGFNLFSLLLA